MFDLHTHSLLSDGVLLPSEIAVRYMSVGYKVIAITDHVDYSNIDYVINAILNFTNHWPKDTLIKVLPGVELTHLPLEQFGPLAKYARSKGIKIIVAHGQSPVEPVIAGTNRAALEADIDILAHPGMISDYDVNLAKEKGIFLEVTARKGHSETNPHVVDRGLIIGAKLIIGTDSHLPEDIISLDKLEQVAIKAGVMPEKLDSIYNEVRTFLKSKI
ncbi:MAG: histidinol phosphate phosphatase domain-containing protein [Candidatus Omnitrophota bacterium]